MFAVIATLLDILRIYGYNNVEITESVHSNLSNKSVADEQHSRYNTIANELTGCGFNEILNNSLTKTSYYKDLTSFPESNCVKVMNPLSSDLGVMRQTLLFGGLESVAYNINRRNADLKFYEFGNCYSFNAEADTEKGALAPYSEEYRMGMWLTGNEVANSWAQKDIQTSFFILKGYIENVLTRLGMKGKYTTEQTSDDIYSAVLVYKTRGGKEIGKAGIISKNILRKFDIETEVYFAEFNFAMLCKESVKAKTTYTELSKFPPVKRDLALLVDTSIKFSEIEKIARESERKLLKEVSLFDVYEGKNLEAGKKSYAVSFILQDTEKTLADKQIDAVMNKIITNLENKVGAKLR